MRGDRGSRSNIFTSPRATIPRPEESRNMKQTRTVLITGAAQRIGRALALSLARGGWDVALHFNTSANEAKTLAALIRKLGRKAYLVQADLQDAKALARIFPALKKQGMVPGCLINNAALFEKDTLATLESESFRAHMETNLFAPLFLMREFAAYYKGNDGNIINITDGMARWSMSAGFLSYALSKEGLGSATRLTARSLAPRIRVNAIAPGATLKGKLDKQDTFDRLEKIIPLRRVSSPQEICDAIQYILSSPSLTGQILSLSGGMDLP